MAEPELKWPKDHLIDGRKLSGMLAAVGPDFVVVGIGVNVNWAPDEAISLAELVFGTLLRPADLLRLLLTNIDELERLSFDQLHATYSAALATIGEQVRIDRVDGTTLVGRATAVHADGRLYVVDDDGVSHLIDTGDIVHLRTK